MRLLFVEDSPRFQRSMEKACKGPALPSTSLATVQKDSGMPGRISMTRSYSI